jgi:hypothetical protein
VGIHDAIAKKLEAVLVFIMGEDTQERLEVLGRLEEVLPVVAPDDDVVDGGGCDESWRSRHERTIIKARATGTIASQQVVAIEKNYEGAVSGASHPRRFPPEKRRNWA